MYVYTKDIVASHINTVKTKDNAYNNGHSGFNIALEITLQTLQCIWSFF